jgi:hypothetical protein
MQPMKNHQKKTLKNIILDELAEGIKIKIELMLV